MNAKRMDKTSVSVTVIDSDNYDEIIKNVLSCFLLPFHVWIDFWAVTCSMRDSAKPDALRTEIMYPTKGKTFIQLPSLYIYIGTYINEKTKIITPDDIEKVANEFAQFPFERLLQVHLVGDNESGIYVNGMLGIEMYIDLYAQHNYA